MRIKGIALSLALFAGINFGFSQPWLYNNTKFKSVSGEPDFKESQAAFNEYYKNIEVINAKGQKQFRRWEYIMSPRLFNNTSLDSKALWKAINDKPTNPPEDSADWMFIGPVTTPYEIETTLKSGNGRLNCIAFHPTDPNTYFVGAPSGGFWKTTNGGTSWTTTTDKLDAIGISDIVVSQEDPSVIYLATGDGDAGDTYAIGIIKSADGGETWNTTGLSLDVANGIYFRKIIMHPENPDTMFATSNRGIYMTTDGWNTFSAKLSTLSFKDIEFKPGDPNYIYATTYSSSGGAAIFRSTNGGTNFFSVSSSLDYSNANRVELAVSPAEPSTIYALASKANDSGLHSVNKSTNNGSTWTLMINDQFENLLGWDYDGGDEGGQGWYDLSLAVSPTDINTVLVGGVNIWKSTNGGSTWDLSSLWYHSSTADYVHADQHMFAYSPLTGDLFAANDGGIYSSVDDGNNWVDKSNDIQILQSYKFGTSQLSEGKIIAGNQDNGTFLLTSDEWFSVLGGDGMQCHIDPTNDDILYGSLYYGAMYRSDDGGLNFSNIKPADAGDGGWVTPFILHPVHSSIIYAGFKDVYKSPDRGATWNSISTNLTTSNLEQLAVSASNDAFIFASHGNTIYKTSNSGESWTTLSSSLPNENITSICISPDDHNEVWITFSGYNENYKVYYTNDGGINWTNFSEGLPNVPANEIIFRENSDKELYLATDIGVYYRHADTNTWINFSNNLPNVIVTDLEIAEDFKKLRAATYGRGVWETNLEEAKPAKATFISNIINGCTDAPIELTYTGKAVYDSLVWDLGGATIDYINTNKDTLIIRYTEVGSKTIVLNHYYYDTVTTKTSTDYLNINSSIDFSINPDKSYVCNDSEMTVYLPSGYDYSVSPGTGVVGITDNILTLQPQEAITYTVTATHGTCSADKEFSILLMPDDICNATYIADGINGPFSNSCGTAQTNEPVPPVGTNSASSGCISQDGWCQGEDVIRNSLWFKIVISETGKIKIKTTGFDTKIALYQANDCNSLLTSSYTMLAANDDTDDVNFASTINAIDQLTPGDTLYLQVDGSYGGVTGEFMIEVINNPPTNLEYKSETISNIKVFPNPANTEFTVRMLVPGKSKVDIDIFDETGKLIKSKPGIEEVSFLEETIDASELKGLYFVRIKTKDQILMRKVIIQK